MTLYYSSVLDESLDSSTIDVQRTTYEVFEKSSKRGGQLMSINPFMEKDEKVR
ncbi:hypothetical protein DPMN_184112 [Dreissena polymorpha]|uniref:Uncharacterized protein n=1 Tax=Dreissena polymorpha TaxID=45954 RepID=A0A9D4DIW8_DREPO|nr:hypothetical protein DPMN_184112 [Dreissena polymorpha]